MEIEKEVFQGYHPDLKKLKKEGFVKDGDRYILVRDLRDGAFAMHLSIDEEGETSSQIIEKEWNEPYTNIYSDSIQGAFVSSLREEYISLLEEIRDRCFEKDPFLHKQTMRIVSYLKKEHGSDPEHVWKRYPDHAVFRNRESGRWYAVITAGEKEILEVMADPATIASLLKEKGFEEAVHLNKEKWIGISMDDIINDEIIHSLLESSYSMIEEGDAWLIPANPKYYDVEAAFEREETILWKQSLPIRAGDIVYLYMAAPVSAILYQCVVEETDIPYSYQDENVRMRDVMKIRRLKKYPPGKYPFSYLNSLGITWIRGQRRLSKEIAEKLG